MPTDGKQELVLRRRQSSEFGLLAAPVEKASEGRAEREQAFVVGLREAFP